MTDQLSFGIEKGSLVPDPYQPPLPSPERLELERNIISVGEELYVLNVCNASDDEVEEHCCPFCDALLPYEGASCRGCDDPGGSKMTDPRGD